MPNFKKSAKDILLPYKSYHALLSQTGTAAPTAKVLLNTLGVVPVLSRTGLGDYKITATGKFTANKTALILGTQIIAQDYRITGYQANANEIIISTAVDGVGEDEVLANLLVEIRVYE